MQNSVVLAVRFVMLPAENMRLTLFLFYFLKYSFCGTAIILLHMKSHEYFGILSRQQFC